MRITRSRKEISSEVIHRSNRLGQITALEKTKGRPQIPQLLKIAVGKDRERGERESDGELFEEIILHL